MKFHEYVTLRNQWVRQTHDPKMKEIARSMKAADFRQFAMELPAVAAAQSGPLALKAQQQCLTAYTEERWVEANRPFYKFWPIAVELAKKVSLDLPWSSVSLPFEALLLRFAQGHEPHSMGTALIHYVREQQILTVDGWIANSPDAYRLAFKKCDPDESVEQILAKATQQPFKKDWIDVSRPSEEREATILMARLAIFVSLLSQDTDLLTPVVLAKDRRRHEDTDNDATKKWLENRAIRQLGRGFEVGRKLQSERDRSPHWRNSHLCLFWTGKGRLTPVIKMRSGTVIQRVSMAEVPTGYLGPETEADDRIPDAVRAERIAISVRKRFEIFKRDNYSCQLCGARAEHGAALHVDHRIPVAKGGANDDANLWTLCDRCNLGKSDSDL